MYPIKIIHISDIHFSSPSLGLEPIDIQKPLIDLINEKVSREDNSYLILSGDITFRANIDVYRRQAKFFFNEVIELTNIDRQRIITCPGNHDIVERSFKNFDIFTYILRGDSLIQFQDTPNVFLDFDSICFLSLNSSYHLDHKYGLVNINSLQFSLEKHKGTIEKCNHRIAVIHHHFLNLSETDTSIVRNSYQTLNLLQSYGFDAVFHGHQHTKQEYNINGIRIKGISSPTEQRASSNLVGYYEIDSDNNLTMEEYLYSKDTIQKGIMGRYIKNG